VFNSIHFANSIPVRRSALRPSGVAVLVWFRVGGAARRLGIYGCCCGAGLRAAGVPAMSAVLAALARSRRGYVDWPPLACLVSVWPTPIGC